MAGQGPFLALSRDKSLFLPAANTPSGCLGDRLQGHLSTNPGEPHGWDMAIKGRSPTGVHLHGWPEEDKRSVFSPRGKSCFRPRWAFSPWACWGCLFLETFSTQQEFGPCTLSDAPGYPSMPSLTMTPAVGWLCPWPLVPSPGDRPLLGIVSLRLNGPGCSLVTHS